MRNEIIACALCSVVVCASGRALAGGFHSEVGDAGDGVGGAWQDPVGIPGDNLSTISGSTSSGMGDIVDAYRIRIVDPMQFLAQTSGGASFDTMLYLFDLSGNAVLANDDFSSLIVQSSLGPMATDGTGASVVAGDYILAVTGFQYDPIDGAGQNLFDIPIGDTTEISGPDGAGGMNPHAGWEDNSVVGIAASGEYTISLRGVEIVPAPGAAVLLGGAGIGFAGRRRREK